MKGKKQFHIQKCRSGIRGRQGTPEKNKLPDDKPLELIINSRFEEEALEELDEILNGTSEVKSWKWQQFKNGKKKVPAIVNNDNIKLFEKAFGNIFQYDNTIRAAAGTYSHVTSELLYAVIYEESKGNQYAVSKAGACGLIQITEPTARDIGMDWKKRFEPEENIFSGASILSGLIERYEGNLLLALSAYNYGKYGLDKKIDRKNSGRKRIKEIDFDELPVVSRHYATRVLGAMKAMQQNYGPPTGLASR